MITCAVVSPIPIISGDGHRLSFSFGFSSALTSASRNRFPLISTRHPINKAVVCSVQTYDFHIPDGVSVHRVSTKDESNREIDARRQNLRSKDAPASAFEGVVFSDPEASSGAKASKKEKNHKTLSSSVVQSKRLDLPVIRYPLGTESAIKAMLERNTLVFVVDKNADKPDIKDSAKKMFKIGVKKVNTSIMPNGTKKAYIMLAPNYNAANVAKKIGIL